LLQLVEPIQVLLRSDPLVAFVLKLLLLRLQFAGFLPDGFTWRANGFNTYIASGDGIDGIDANTQSPPFERAPRTSAHGDSTCANACDKIRSRYGAAGEWSRTELYDEPVPSA